MAERVERRRSGERAGDIPADRPARRSPAVPANGGNALLAAWLARRPRLSRAPAAPAAADAAVQELWDRCAVVPPHSGGGAEGLLGLLDPDPGTDDWLRDALGLPASAPAVPAAAPPAADKAVTDWQARKPATNAEYAQWVLDGEPLGFVTFTAGMGAKVQMTDLAAGKKVSGVDPGQSAILGGLATIHDLVGARVTRWVADPAKDKSPLMVGSFIRTSGHRGQAIDINGLDWTGPGGPAQVAALLHDLPKGKYGIGLPFQGQFLPAERELAARLRTAEAKAGDGTPEPITDASLQRFVTDTYTATWNAGKHAWDIVSAGGRAVDHIKSSDLKKAIRDLNADGYGIYVFPDNDSHIHVQQ